jgi:8-oxo-dGTP diphosphatase
MKIVAKSLVFDSDGRVLILQRSETHPNYAHHFDFPGGEVEGGENAAEAVSREILEETGLVVDAASFAQVYEKQVDETLRHIVCTATYNRSQPNIRLSWEHENYEWLSVESLLNKQIPHNADDYYLTAMGYVVSAHRQGIIQ